MTKPDKDIAKYSPSPGFMRDIRPYEITLTSKAANKREYLLFKSEDNTMNEELLKILQETEADNEDELEKAIESLDLDGQTVDAVKAIARLRSAFSDEISGEALAKALGYELEASQEDVDDDGTITKSDLEKMDAQTREKVEALAEQHDDLQKSYESIVERLDEADRERRLADWTAKAEELGSISVDASELGEHLLKIEENVGEEVAKSHLESLRSANEVASETSDLFKESGSSRSGDIGGETYEKVQKMADNMMENSGGELGRVDAINKVFDQNPELEAQYYEETRG